MRDLKFLPTTLIRISLNEFVFMDLKSLALQIIPFKSNLDKILYTTFSVCAYLYASVNALLHSNKLSPCLAKALFD